MARERRATPFGGFGCIFPQAASAVRAARQTFCEIDQWHSWLKEAAFDCLPIVLPLQGVFTPPGWTQASVVEHAFNSKHLVRFSDDLKRATEEAIAKVPQGRSIQKAVMKEVCNSFECSLDQLVLRRLQVLCPGFVFSIETSVARWAKFLSEKSLKVRVMAFRSLVNSWTTSYRFHEAVLLPCVFGCSKLCPRPPPKGPKTRPSIFPENGGS